MLRLQVLLITALLAEGSWGFAWDGGTPSPHRRSLALPSSGRPASSGSQVARTLQRGLLQDDGSSRCGSGSSNGSSSSDNSTGQRPCTPPSQPGGAQSDMFVQVRPRLMPAWFAFKWHVHLTPGSDCSCSACCLYVACPAHHARHAPLTVRPGWPRLSSVATFMQICGDRSACSVLLAAIGAIVLLVIFACGLGGLCSRWALLLGRKEDRKKGRKRTPWSSIEPRGHQPATVACSERWAVGLLGATGPAGVPWLLVFAGCAALPGWLALLHPDRELFQPSP